MSWDDPVMERRLTRLAAGYEAAARPSRDLWRGIAVDPSAGAPPRRLALALAAGAVALFLAILVTLTGHVSASGSGSGQVAGSPPPATAAPASGGRLSASRADVSRRLAAANRDQQDPVDSSEL